MSEQDPTKELTDDEADKHMNQKIQDQQELDVASEADKADVDNDYQDLPVQEELNFKLSITEKALAVDDILVLTKKRNALEIAAKESAKQFKAQVVDTQAEIDAVLMKVEEGDDKLVDCIKRTHFGHNKVYFLIEGEAHKERPLRDEDRQLQLVSAAAPESFASESDSIDAGSGVAKEEPLEKVNEETLTTNKPVDF